MGTDGQLKSSGNVALERTVTVSDASVRDVLAGQDGLRRSFSIWSLGGLCLCLMATWEALSSTVAQALVSGGAPCLFYNYLISFAGSIAIVTSLAEIASMYPTAGGQYHWVAVMAPTKQKIIASWFTAWISIGGQVMLTASAALAGGLQLQALITLNHLDSYVPKRWQGMLFYDLVLLYSLLLNVFGVRVLPHTNSISGVLHIVGFVAIIIVLGVMAPKSTAASVFVETTNQTGWANAGIAWLIGLLSSTYSMLGYDAATHLSEELPDPKRKVPIAMVGSVIVNGVIGLIYCIILLFSLGDLDSVLTSKTGFPFMQIFLNATQSPAGATVMSLIVSLVAIAANAAGLTSTSRTAWSLARDNALPQAGYLSHVDERFHVPVRMIIAISILEFILGFIYLGNSTAFNAVLSMAILGMYLSYLLPIIYMVPFRRKGPEVYKSGPFSLGRAGIFVNTFAMCWLVLMMFFSTWPNFYPVTSVNMNYSTVVLAAWIFFGIIYYLFSGRHRYTGPLVELEGISGIKTNT